MGFSHMMNKLPPSVVQGAASKGGLIGNIARNALPQQQVQQPVAQVAPMQPTNRAMAQQMPMMGRAGGQIGRSPWDMAAMALGGRR